MKIVAIVLLNFNGKSDTLACLETINKLATTNFRLLTILVDNGSSDGSLKAVTERFPHIKIVANKKNLGFAEGNNRGISWALSQNADFIFVLNNDTLLAKDSVINLVAGINNNDSWGIVAPKIYFAKGYEYHKDRYQEQDKGRVIWYAGGKINWDDVVGVHRGVDEVDVGQFDKPEETDFASGCAMLVKREVFEKIGLFDKRYFLYYEDLDFNLRAQRSGYLIGYYPKSVIWHKNAASARGSGSELQDYYISRNRLLFGMQYAPLKAKLSLLKESFSLLLKGRRWQKKAVKDFYLRKFGKGSYPFSN